MPRKSNQKHKLHTLRRILTENTDVRHPMTMNQILTALSDNGIPAERKSVYSDIEALKYLGVDIQTVRSKTVGYYVASREFELSELKLLVDAVSASKFIPEKQSAKLIQKLTLLASSHDRPSLNRGVIVSNRAKTIDNDIFSTVDIIHEAIEKDLTISFKYFSWNPDKTKEYRNGGSLYRVSPWALVWDDNNYYLVGYNVAQQQIRHYRVDKMESPQLTDEKRQGSEAFKLFDMASYTDSVFGMFGGKPQRVTLSCANRLSNVMLDRFGKGIPILKESENSFKITVNVVTGPVFYGWVLSFGKEIKILSPESAKNELEDLRNSYE